MAKFTKYTKKNGEAAWMFNTYLGTDPIKKKQKRTTRRGFRTKKEAMLEEARLKIEVEKNGFNSQKTTVPTYQETYDMWIEVYRKTVQESTLHKTIRLFENHILPVYGHRQIDQIDVQLCQKSVNHWFTLTTNYKIINRYSGRVFAYAISLNLTNDNPTQKVTLPVNVAKIQNNEDEYGDFFNGEELKHFLDCVAKEASRTKTLKWLTFFQLLAYTGLRRGEALALNWDDIDFDNATLKVSKAVTRGLNNRIIIQPPKTSSSNRKLSLTETTLKLLKKWKEEQDAMNNILGYKSSNATRLIFSNTKNSIINPTKPRQKLFGIYDRYDIKKRIKLHGFRHTHCSLLFESNASIKEVQDRLGHGDVKTTMNVYAHVTQKSKDKTAEKFEEYMKNFS